ncbi:MAG: FecR domain-containing protein [Alphaproteobacteria bacterium]|nr:FecR domain-containing protein [Alphaproteobacteria bacterium]
MTLRNVIRASALALTLCLAAPSFAAESIGVVGALQGTANAAGTTGARALKVGDQVFLDEEVTTGAGSKLQLMLNDRSTITLNPNSKVKVREFAYDASADSGSMAMESVKGAFRFIGGALSKQNPVTIKTPVSSIGIRGGIADAFVGPQGQTDAVFHYGDAMTMTNANGQTIEITQPGQGLSMQTPTDVPSFTPPAVLQQHIGSFDALPNAGTSGEGAANGTQPASQEPNQGGGGEEGTTQKQGDANTQGGTSQGGTTQNGAPQGRTAPGGTTAGTGQDGSANQQQFGAFGGSAPTNNIINSPTSDALTGRVSTDAINTTQLINQATTVATNATVSGTSLVNTQGEFKGRYGIIVPQTGNTKERGSVVAIRQGDQFLISANEFSPNFGNQHVGKIPVLNSAGTTALTNPILIDPSDTTFYTGFGYATSSLNSFYYHLDPVGNTEDLNLFFGRQIPASLLGSAMSNTVANSSATNGITYFKFAPDLLTFDGSLSTPQLGYFDYEVLNIGATSFIGVRDTSFGLAADFSTKRFLSGFIDWSGATANRDVAIAFGSIGSDSAGGSLNGVIYDFSQSGNSLTGIATKQGGISSGPGTIYGDSNNQIEALMIEGTSPQGQSILTPVIRVAAGDVDPTINEDRTAGTQQLQGFAAGHMGVNVGGTPTVKNVWNTHSNGVTVTTNSGSGTASGTLALFDKTDNTKTVTTQFGTNNTQSAYLSNDLYAAQQSGVTYGGNFAGTGTNGTYGGNGFIANAEAMSNVSNYCNSCDFVHWGVWAGNVNRAPGGATAVTDSTYVVPYVVGQVTDSANIPSIPGNTFYTGAMYGSEYNSTTSTLERFEGDFTAGINLSTRQVTSFTGDIGSFSNIEMTGGPVSIAASGPANFNFNIADTGASATGVVNGALFGPVADNIGGNYSITSTGGINGTGVYLGDRP